MSKWLTTKTKTFRYLFAVSGSFIITGILALAGQMPPVASPWVYVIGAGLIFAGIVIGVVAHFKGWLFTDEYGPWLGE